MDPFTAGLLIAGGGALVGGYFNSRAIKQANAANVAAQNEANQHGVSWRVADARRAGIDPLAALGFQTPSAAAIVGDTSYGDAIGNASQNIASSVYRSSDPLEKQYKQQQLRLMTTQADAAEYDLVRTIGADQIRRMSLGAPGTPGVLGPSKENYTSPALGWMHYPDGVVAPIPGKEVKERLEDSKAEDVWFANAYGTPFLSSRPGYKPPFSAGKGKVWDWVGHGWKAVPYYSFEEGIRRHAPSGGSRGF